MQRAATLLFPLKSVKVRVVSCDQIVYLLKAVPQQKFIEIDSVYAQYVMS